jgi:tetratricopeptide (TPR) repeat protein
VGNLGRERAALTDLVNSYLAEGGNAADDYLKRLSSERKGAAATSQLIADAYFARKRPDEAVTLLKNVWVTEPSSLLQNLHEVGNRYIEAGRIEALVEGLRSVHDQNLRNQLGYQLQRTMPQLLIKARNADDMLALYEAALDLVPENQRGNAASQVSNVLGRLPRTMETLAAYRRIALPTSKDEGRLWEFARPLADLAKQLYRIGELEADAEAAMREHPAWKPRGEFLVALLRRRRDEESAIMDLARRYRSDPALAKALAPALGTLRAELTQCKSPEALRQAIGLWQPQGGVANMYNQQHALEQVGTLWHKLGEPAKARETWLSILNEGYSGDVDDRSVAQQEVQRRVVAANLLASNGFRLDAAVVYDSLGSIDTSGLDHNDYAQTQIAEGINTGRQVVRDVLAQDADATLRELVKRLRSTTRPLDLSAYFVTLETLPLSHVQGNAPPSETEPFSPLLPALLAHARRTKGLDLMAEATTEARQGSPDDLSLIVLEALIDLTRDQTNEAQARLNEIVEWVKAKPESARLPAVWVAARTALAQPQTRDIGLELAELVVKSAEKEAWRPRDLAALGAVADVLLVSGQVDRARKLVPNVNDESLAALQLAGAFLRAGKADEAAPLLGALWTKEPLLPLSRFGELAVLYANGGAIDGLIKMLQSSIDSNLMQQNPYALVNAITGVADQIGDVDAVAKLYRVAERIAPAQREYALSQLASFLERKSRKADAYGAFREGVLTPATRTDQLPNIAINLAKLAQELGRLEELEAQCREAQQSRKDWTSEGELLLAMIRRRRGDESAFEQLVVHYRDDQAFADKLANTAYVLRSELTECRSRPVLELARDLWQEEIDRRLEQPYNQPDFQAYDQLGQVLFKLGLPEQARQSWLKVFNELPSLAYGSPEFAATQMSYQREYAADRLSKNGFPLDALRLYEQNLTAFPRVAGDELTERYRRRKQRAEYRKSILELIAKKPDEALVTLESELKAANPDFSGFVALLPEPWLPTELERIPASERGPVPAWTQLLPALLAHASDKKLLNGLGAAVEVAVARNPQHESLNALAILVSLARNDAKAAAPRLDAWLERAAKETEFAARAESLLIAQAAVRETPVREEALRLLDLAFAAAGSRGDFARQAALLEATLPPDAWQPFRSAHPASFERLASWHQEEASASEKEGSWPQAVWHLGNLIRAEPTRAGLFARRAGALAAVGDRDGAAADFGRFAGLSGDGQHALLFVGRGDTVTVPHLDFDAFGGFSVEAWVLGWNGPLLCEGVTNDPENSLWMSVGAAASQRSDANCGWRSGRGIDHVRSLGEPPRDSWVHLAMVFDGERQILFVNGKRVQAVASPRPGPLDKLRAFIVGSHAFKEPTFGSGLLGALRVSKVPRYGPDFTPERAFETDEQTVLLLDAAQGDAKLLPDRSGQGRDGTIRGPSRVRSEKR